MHGLLLDSGSLMGFLRVAYSDGSHTLAFPQHRLVLPSLQRNPYGIVCQGFLQQPLVKAVLAPLLQNEAILWHEGC